MSSGYIYLLQPLRSIIDNKNIYKIGKTKRNNYKRFNEYPNGSILLLQSSCNNCDLMEKHLLKLFDEFCQLFDPLNSDSLAFFAIH